MSTPHSPKLPRIRFGVPKLDMALAAWHAAIERCQAITAVAPARIEDTGDGPVFSLDVPYERYVKLTADLGGGAYSATEVHPSAGGGFTTVGTPWTGSVREYNATTGLPVTGAYVVRVRFYRQSSDWRFQNGKCT